MTAVAFLDGAPNEGVLSLLDRHLAVVVRSAVRREDAETWAERVLAARADWTSAFGGEQFSLGRAFYTHLEEDRLSEYFEGARASDARVERVLPGFQSTMRALAAHVTGGRVTARPDFCGAGVHVFPARDQVAREGGVIHFDTEGLPVRHVQRGKRALSLVLMMRPPPQGGGLTLWDVLHDPEEELDEDARVLPEDLRDVACARVRSEPGDLVVFDSLRLHQIDGWSGGHVRVSATLHAAETMAGAWETWF